ncbi:hypothetical protein GC722_01635 [Auraticoccus sp. F435]|uniref:Uncharacterized protein n=1 Tax=Auraticoccus cholistanensis TaxID=2656650 RepID=A0A6A9UPY5_9ACTN|nr:hypothetical protein [Auraticoccus cholistanensis]MVA74741.1 hypothetical protein [Auraticoccus cholistanensis]
MTVLLGVPLLMIATGFVCQLLRLSGPAVDQLPALVAAVPAVVTVVRNRRRSRSRPDLPAVSRGQLARPGPWLAGVFGVAVLVVDSLLGAALGTVAGVAISSSGGDPAALGAAMSGSWAVVTMPVLAVLTFLLAARAAHYLPRRAAGWLLLGLAFSGLLRGCVIAVASVTGMMDVFAMSALQWLGGIVIMLVLLVVPVLAGVWVSRRTHDVFSASAFFRRLPPERRQEVLAALGDWVAGRAPQGWPFPAPPPGQPGPVTPSWPSPQQPPWSPPQQPFPQQARPWPPPQQPSPQQAPQWPPPQQPGPWPPPRP